MPVNISPTPDFMKKFKNVKSSAQKFGKKAKKAGKKSSKLVKAMQSMSKGKSMMGMSDDDGDE